MSLHVETIAAESTSSREGRWDLVEANLVILLIEMARLIESKADADSTLPGGRSDRHAADSFRRLSTGISAANAPSRFMPARSACRKPTSTASPGKPSIGRRSA